MIQNRFSNSNFVARTESSVVAAAALRVHQSLDFAKGDDACLVIDVTVLSRRSFNEDGSPATTGRMRINFCSPLL
jgi:hypothetical protein